MGALAETCAKLKKKQKTKQNQINKLGVDLKSDKSLTQAGNNCDLVSANSSGLKNCDAQTHPITACY